MSFQKRVCQKNLVGCYVIYVWVCSIQVVAKVAECVCLYARSKCNLGSDIILLKGMLKIHHNHRMHSKGTFVYIQCIYQAITSIFTCFNFRAHTS